MAEQTKFSAKTAKSLLDTCTAIMTDVSTDTLRDVRFSQDDFQNAYDSLTFALVGLGLGDNPLQWRELKLWRGYWQTHLPTYAGRRAYVRNSAASTYETLERLEQGLTLLDPKTDGDDTWAGLNQRIDELGTKLPGASTLDDWQDCGRRGREILVHLSKLMSVKLSGVGLEEVPQAGNGKAWMDIFLETYAAGPSHQTLRSFYRSTWDLAQRTTHADVDDVEAFASSQAVILIVRTTERLLNR